MQKRNLEIIKQERETNIHTRYKQTLEQSTVQIFVLLSQMYYVSTNRQFLLLFFSRFQENIKHNYFLELREIR